MNSLNINQYYLIGVLKDMVVKKNKDKFYIEDVKIYLYLLDWKCCIEKSHKFSENNYSIEYSNFIVNSEIGFSTSIPDEYMYIVEHVANTILKEYRYELFRLMYSTYPVIKSNRDGEAFKLEELSKEYIEQFNIVRTCEKERVNMDKNTDKNNVLFRCDCGCSFLEFEQENAEKDLIYINHFIDSGWDRSHLFNRFKLALDFLLGRKRLSWDIMLKGDDSKNVKEWFENLDLGE